MNLHDLPRRRGLRPQTTATNPHSQLSDVPAKPFSEELLKRIDNLPDVTLRLSNRAPLGTFGAFLSAAVAKGPPEAFLTPLEFAHLHAAPDASFHLTLPESLRGWAIDAGWAEAHPLAGRPTISRAVVMIYAPRDISEVDTVMGFVTASWTFARGDARRL